MAYSYKYLPDIVIADVAFEARGDTPAELFRAAALATVEVMIKLADLHPVVHRKMTVRAENLEDLLYAWLAELIYVKDVEHLIFADYDISINRNADGCQLSAQVAGEKIDQSRHELGQDIKAVTYHLFEIKEVNRQFVARVVLDI